MPVKMTDSGLKYFIAINENKRKDLELRCEESKIDDLQKRMLTRYWKDKINIFDDMIRLNVKTPTYNYDRPTGEGDEDDDNTFSMGSVNIDSKLLSNKPVSLQRGKKAGPGRMEPVISIEGFDAVCYPNKEARKGRRVGLNQRVLHRLEQCKTLSDNIASVRYESQNKEDREIIHVTYRRNESPVRRPKTAAPKKSKNPKPELKRPDTTGSNVRPHSTKVSAQLQQSNSALESKLSTWKQHNPIKRPSTSIGSFTADNPYLVTEFRASTSLSFDTTDAYPS